MSIIHILSLSIPNFNVIKSIAYFRNEAINLISECSLSNANNCLKAQSGSASNSFSKLSTKIIFSGIREIHEKISCIVSFTP